MQRCYCYDHFCIAPTRRREVAWGICHPQDWRKNIFPPIWISSNLVVTLNWIEVNFVLTLVLYKTWQEPKNVVSNSEMYTSKMVATSFEKVWGEKTSTLRISLLIYDVLTAPSQNLFCTCVLSSCIFGSCNGHMLLINRAPKINKMPQILSAPPKYFCTCVL